MENLTALSLGSLSVGAWEAAFPLEETCFETRVESALPPSSSNSGVCVDLACVGRRRHEQQTCFMEQSIYARYKKTNKGTSTALLGPRLFSDFPLPSISYQVLIIVCHCPIIKSNREQRVTRRDVAFVIQLFPI